MILHAIQNSRGEPILSTTTPSSTPLSFSRPLPSDKWLIECCQIIQENADLGQWETVLQKAEEMQQAYTTDFARLAQSIQSECDFRPSVARAGIKLAQPFYDAADYQQTKNILERAITILEPLMASDSNDDYRSLKILYQCAKYQIHISADDPTKALETWEILLPYSEQPSFYNDFYKLCHMDYNQAAISLTPTPEPPPPTPMPTPCKPTLPKLVAPTAGSQHQIGSNVFFEWDGGYLCEDYVWQVTIDGDDSFCPSTIESNVSCTMYLQPEEHQWRVEIRDSNGNVVPAMMTPPQSLIIIPTSSNGSNDSTPETPNRS